jgi:hypothetical protein
MYQVTVYDENGALLEQSEQAEPVDIEALCKTHELGFWRRTHRVEKFAMTTYWCYHGRIHVKHIEKEEQR